MEFAGTRPHTDETCRHCEAEAVVRVEMGPVSFGLCADDAPDHMLEGR